MSSQSESETRRGDNGVRATRERGAAQERHGTGGVPSVPEASEPQQALGDAVKRRKSSGGDQGLTTSSYCDTMSFGRGVGAAGESDSGSSTRLPSAPLTRRARDLNGPGAPPEERGAAAAGADTGAVLRPTAPTEPWQYASLGDMRRNYDELGEAFGDWIARMANWQWFVTCTLRPPKNPRFSVAGPGEARRCLRSLLERTFATDYICVFELQGNGATHLHSLLAGCGPVNAASAAAYFEKRFGVSRWKIYKEGGAAPKYVGKYLAKDIVQMYIGTRGPWVEEDFKVYTGKVTKSGTPGYQWSTDMRGHRV